MKTLLATIVVLMLAVACVSPYQQVYVSGEGDYYITGTSAATVYWDIDYWGYGGYPWWSWEYYYGYPTTSPYYYDPYWFTLGYYRWPTRYFAGPGWHPPYRRYHDSRPVYGHGGSYAYGGPTFTQPTRYRTVTMPTRTPQRRYVGQNPSRQTPPARSTQPGNSNRVSPAAGNSRPSGSRIPPGGLRPKTTRPPPASDFSVRD